MPGRIGLLAQEGLMQGISLKLVRLRRYTLGAGIGLYCLCKVSPGLKWSLFCVLAAATMLGLAILARIEAGRFLIGGAVVTVIYFSVYLRLVERKGVNLVMASWVAFFPSFTVNFIIQKFWTFQNDDVGSAWWQFGLFATKYFLLQNANTLLIVYFARRWKLTPRWAQITTTAILTVVSYIVSHFIFKR